MDRNCGFNYQMDSGASETFGRSMPVFENIYWNPKQKIQETWNKCTRRHMSRCPWVPKRVFPSSQDDLGLKKSTLGHQHLQNSTFVLKGLCQQQSHIKLWTYQPSNDARWKQHCTRCKDKFFFCDFMDYIIKMLHHPLITVKHQQPSQPGGESLCCGMFICLLL